MLILRVVFVTYQTGRKYKLYKMVVVFAFYAFTALYFHTMLFFINRAAANINLLTERQSTLHLSDYVGPNANALGVPVRDCILHTINALPET